MMYDDEKWTLKQFVKEKWTFSQLLAVFLLIGAVIFFDWVSFCLIYKVVGLCFNFNFNYAYATGFYIMWRMVYFSLKALLDKENK